MRNWKKRGLIWGALAIITLGGIGAFVYQMVWPGPSVLVIHAPQQRWRQIDLMCGPEDGISAATLMAMTPPRQEYSISPFQHGHHELLVWFTDGKVIRAMFNHSDMKAVRQMDISIDRAANSDRVHLREVINRRSLAFSSDVTAVTSANYSLPPVMARM